MIFRKSVAITCIVMRYSFYICQISCCIRERFYNLLLVFSNYIKIEDYMSNKEAKRFNIPSLLLNNRFMKFVDTVP